MSGIANAAAARQRSQTGPQPIQIQTPALDLEAAFGTPPPPIDFVLPGFIAGTVGGLVAPGAAGKSWWALQAAALIAAGVDTLGLCPRALGLCPRAFDDSPADPPFPTGPVAVIAAEDPPIALQHRIHALGERLEPEERETVAERLTVQPVAGQRIDLLDPRWQATLTRLAERCRLLVLDTLRRVHGADENSSSEMSQIVGVLEHIAAESGASVLFLHHSSKAAALGGQVDAQQGARGSTVLTDNTRWQAYLAGMSAREAQEYGISDADRRRYCRWGISKQNYGPPALELWYERTHAGLEPVRLIRREQPTGRWTREF